MMRIASKLTVMQACKGYAPRYSTVQKGRLRQVLFAARHILLDCFGKLEDSRTGEDLIPWMLQVSLYPYTYLYIWICCFRFGTPVFSGHPLALNVNCAIMLVQLSSVLVHVDAQNQVRTHLAGT